MQFEVEVYKDDAGQWVATAVEYGVSVTAPTEKDALGRIMEALAAHFRKPQGMR
jgi:hypothetical protein